MKKKKILLTGDDGYNSLGTRLLIHYLRDSYELFVVGTLYQQSGVGGHISLKSGGTYGETTVDGIRAMWLDGYPCDAMEACVGRFGDFDIVISGINMGENIGGSIVSSGTYSAALRSMNLHLAKKGIAISWKCPASMYHMNHDHNKDSIEIHLEHPGKTAFQVIQMAIKKNFWGADLLNINIPAEKSETIVFTQPLPDLRMYYRYPIDFYAKEKRFHYPDGEFLSGTKKFLTYDTGALLNNLISITPHKISLLDEDVYKKMKKRKLHI